MNETYMRWKEDQLKFWIKSVLNAFDAKEQIKLDWRRELMHSVTVLYLILH